MKSTIKLIGILILLIITLSFSGCEEDSVSNMEDHSEQNQINSEQAIKTEDADNDIDLQEASEEVEESLKDEENDLQAKEEELRKAEEELKAEEERLKEEERKQEEEQRKAEEERLKAEEEQRRAEEEKKKAEEEKRISEEKNSFSMMYYLAITAEEIRTSKDNRIALEDIYTSLLNDINPGAINEITQDHLKNLRDIIKSYISISTKRERLQYIYNQNKAEAIRSAVPNPIAVLSMTKSLDWKKLAMNAVYTAVDSYNSYKKAVASADKEFLMSGWELDDEEVETVQKNRDRAFDYMVDMVQEYHLDGMLTLNEKSIEQFAEICAIEDAPERIKRLESEEKTYKLLGNYWLELADSYFETSKYQKCIDCVNKYNELSTGIYRKDYNYAQILPKVIVAAQNTYFGDRYVPCIQKYTDDLMANTSSDDWSIRYFAAQVYLDLYSRTGNKDYLKNAYDIADNNVTNLLAEQRELNKTYIEDVKDLAVAEPDYKYLTEEEKKKKEEEYNEEKKKAKEYNKAQRELRKTELPSLYEPLILNCELLFALADELGISNEDKEDIEAVLKTSTNGTFISKPINDAYSFSNKARYYRIGFDQDEITIPVELLTSGSSVSVIVTEKDKTSKQFDDCVISKVDRKGKTIDTFTAYYTSKQLEDYDWTPNSKIKVVICYKDANDRSTEFDFMVSKYEEHWYGDEVVFGAR